MHERLMVGARGNEPLPSVWRIGRLERPVRKMGR